MIFGPDAPGADHAEEAATQRRLDHDGYARWSIDVMGSDALDRLRPLQPPPVIEDRLVPRHFTAQVGAVRIARALCDRVIAEVAGDGRNTSGIHPEWDEEADARRDHGGAA